MTAKETSRGRRGLAPLELVLALPILLFVSGLIFAPLALSAAEAAKSNGEKLSVEVTEKPKLTREYLLANGFKQSAKNPDSFTVESVRLGDISKKLNFPLSALRRTVSSAPESDMRIVTVRDMEFVVRSEVHGPDFRAVERSFKSPDTLCTVGVSLKKRVPPKPPLKSDSTPRVQVKSVTVPKDRAKPLQVTFELAADGKTPVGLIQDQFHVYVIQGDSQAFTGTVQFPAHSVHRVLVRPESPITYTVKAWPNVVSVHPATAATPTQSTPANP